MPEDDTLNSQIKDSVQYANHTVMGHAPAHSSSMLDALMAETIGMAMYNAVNTQHNSQMISSAAITAACAKMLKVQAIPWLPQAAAVTVSVTGVTAVTGQANTFTVTGSGFAPGLIVDIFGNGNQVNTVTATGVQPTSFTLQTSVLTPGGSFMMQAVNKDQNRSAPFAFAVPSAPTLSSVSPVSPNTFKLSGDGFVAPVSVYISGNGMAPVAVTGAAIAGVTPTTFTMQTNVLAPGWPFMIQVANLNTPPSAPVPYSSAAVVAAPLTITPVAGQPDTYTVTGSGFAPGLSVEISQGSTQLPPVTSPAISNVLPGSFSMQTNLLTPGDTFGIQVVNPGMAASPAVPYTAPAS